MEPNALQQAIRRLAFGESLSADEAAGAFGTIMRGEATPGQVGALLMALRVKGETPDEVAGAARALREAMVRVPTHESDQLVDTCGTGGGAVTTFNISTAAAFLAAGLGARVAKHGNRSFTSRCGSADLLEALGVPLDATSAQLAHVLREAGIVFMFAPAMHPAMRHVGPVRRELAVPTVMNVVGPLANPAGAGRQVVGVAEERRIALLAGALRTLGSRRALVVYGDPGLDEISPLAGTHVAEVSPEGVKEWRIDPHRLGMGDVRAEDLAGGGPPENARIVRDVLEGHGAEGARAAVALNAAAALYVSGRFDSFEESVEASREGLARGAGAEALARMLRAYEHARSAETPNGP
jgi:anthranilate phosphoribosyltransferase